MEKGSGMKVVILNCGSKTAVRRRLRSVSAWILPGALIIAVLMALTSGCEKVPEQPPVPTRTVVDVAGRTVAVPVKPERVATMPGPTYEMVFALGAKTQIGLVRESPIIKGPLALLTNPDLARYPSIAGVGPQTPVNIEEYIRKKVDLVIYYNITHELAKFEMTGIPAIVVTWSIDVPATLDEAMAEHKRQLKFLANVLGGEAPQRYQQWACYLDETVAFIRTRTASIPPGRRPTVYWGNSWGGNILATWVTKSNRHVVDLCGGRLLGVEKGGKFPEITREQLLAWAPEAIIVDNHGRRPGEIVEELTTSPDWSTLPAVKNGRIYKIPAGVFFLDKGASSPVYYYWLAKQLNPGLFDDVDLEEKIRHYFRTFYGYNLTAEEAERVLHE